MARSPVRAAGDGTLLSVIVSPNAPRSELQETDAARGAVRIRVAAPASKGAANRELLRFLAALFGVPRSSLRITAGPSDRRKTVAIPGLDVATVVDRLHQGEEHGLSGTP